MEKEQILSTLNEQLGKTSLSTRTINDYVDGNLPADGGDFDFEKHVKILKSLGGNLSADVAAAVNDFKKNYKVENPTPEPKKDDNSDLLKRIEQLEQLNANNAKNASMATLRNEASAKGKSLKVANEAIWADAVKAVEIGENDSVDDVIANAKKVYEKQLRRYMGEGVAPYGNSGRQGASKEAEEAAKNKRDAMKKKMQARGRLPKNENE